MWKRYIVSQFFIIGFTILADRGTNMLESSLTFGLVLLGIGLLGVLVTLSIALKSQPEYQIATQLIIANKLAHINKRNEYNQNVLTLHMVITELVDDIKDDQMRYNQKVWK